MNRVWGLLLVVLVVAGAAAVALRQAQDKTVTLSLQGDRFAVNGNDTFLVFVSYFDGLRRLSTDDPPVTEVLDADLAYFASVGLAGLRVLPNWAAQGATALMEDDGDLRDVQLRQLRALIDRAAQNGLVLDVSFTWNSPMTKEQYKSGVLAATTALIGKRNVLFDLQNEVDSTPNPYGGGVVNVGTWATYLATEVLPAVKALDPSRIVTLSFGGGVQTLALGTTISTASFIKSHGFDVLTYHDARDAGGKWAASTGDRAADLRRDLSEPPAHLKPIYFQEPNRFRGTQCSTACDDSGEHYEIALRNAKASGAAAWTFHSDPSRPLSGKTPFSAADCAVPAILSCGERTFLNNGLAVLKQQN